ncbi:MAG TPA: metal-dependent hydrolase [Solirubrobacteraceae bacterium]|jgi:membrane-bound metal-dependent hydrolase YbcI (DUF457 family)|nr:metal-dependent hydrolase [Solirubrobacteraceae bacterium]
MHPYHGWPFLTSPHHPTLSAVGAVLIHGCISLFVVLPIVIRGTRRVIFALLAFIGGSALDLDHVAAAGSLRPQALETLQHRPDTHSLLFAVALTLLAFAFTRSKPIAWSVFAVIVSHLLFDAAGGNEYWLYPLRHPDSIPWLACPVGIAVTFGVSAVVARTDRSLPHTYPIEEHLRREVGGGIR